MFQVPCFKFKQPFRVGLQELSIGKGKDGSIKKYLSNLSLVLPNMRNVLVLFESGEIREIRPFSETGVPIDKKGTFYCRVNKEKYLDTVNKLQAHIKRGDIYEINYCIEFYAENISVSPAVVLQNLKNLTDAPYAGMYQYGDEIIICASPECFIKKEGNKLITRPMKGTAPRGKNQTEDTTNKKALAQSQKERTENIMALDVARNDLSRVAQKGTVTTTGLCEVLTFKNVHQMVSTVECFLKKNTGLPEIIKAVFPPASMTGAPKIRACELIDEYEFSSRGIYSGCLGSIAENGDFEFCVVIRTLIYNPHKQKISFSVGSAITAMANAEEEWQECMLKADSLLKALGALLQEVKFGQ